MINAIYASKLYRASKRKDQIEAAFNSAASAELVTQLQSYLDTPYQKLASQPKDDVADDTGTTPEGGDESNSSAPSDKGGSAPSHHSSSGGGGFSMPSSLDPGDLGDDFSPEDNLFEVPEDDSEGGDEVPDTSDTPDEAVEEATVIEGSTNILDDIDVVKGTLNGNEKTAGVSRIQTKENELWIYYNDDINLNNIMTDVIEYFNAAGYTDLEFNRLARSDNAIVFVINDVEENIKSSEKVEGVKE